MKGSNKFMSTTSKRRIEKQAIHFLNDVLLDYDKLDTNFPERDKEISWDGYIDLYKNENIDDKGNFQGRIPTQIKGHKVKNKEEFQQEEVSFSADIKDLKNYEKGNGVIFFLVYFDTNRSIKIYYRCLLKFDLLKLINDIEIKQNKSTKNIKLKTFNYLNQDECYSIFLNFIEDSKHAQNAREDISSFKEFETKVGKNIKNYNLTFNCVTNSNGTTDFFNYGSKHELYLYAEDSTLKTKIPIDKMTLKSFILKPEGKKIDVKVGNRTFYQVEHIEQEIDKNLIFYFGEGYEFNALTGNLKYKSKMKVIEKKIEVLSFFISLLKEETLLLNDHAIHFNDQDKENKIKEMKVNIKQLKDLQNVLSQFNLKENFNLGQLDKEDIRTIEILKKSIYKDLELINNTGKQFKEVNNYKLNNLSIKLICFKRKQDGNEILYFRDYYDINNNKNIKATFTNIETGKDETANYYLPLIKKDFLTDSNINYNNIKQSFIDDNEFTKYNELYIDFLIQMLLAYDENKNDELYELALFLSDLLYNDELSYTNIINKFQVIKRKRKLNDNEIFQLLDIKTNLIKDEDTQEKYEILTAVNILLESHTEAEVYLNKLNEQKKEYFIKYPIYNLKNKTD